ncbi:MAG: pyridoxal-phosphate dependent enzyme, partial [Bacteroidota bacterium]|nr:pyridoxal-phosphate dependent enzyme [Bacteroidota bacterium]
HSPNTRIIGVEAAGAPSMHTALKEGTPVTLKAVDPFVDGAAVKRVGEITFPICKEILEDLVLVPEGRVCSTLLELYTRDAIVAEPAGALSIAALENIRESIKGKTVVCILSGGNNDIDRIPEIKERSLIFEGLKHYFLVQFPQRPGALKEFVISVLGPGDDITRFEYMQKHNKETGPALIGIELKVREDIHPLMKRLQKEGFKYKRLSNDQEYLNYFL